MPDDRTSEAFETSLADVLRTARRITRGNPSLAWRALRALWHQRQAALRRVAAAARGTRVPPFVIYSVTGHCNFHCAGCYATALHVSERPELSREQAATWLEEAKDLGVSVMLIAGGEPLLRDDLFDLMAARREILFLLFTNGSLLDAARVERLRRLPHVVPVLSLEGDAAETDARRGAGVYGDVTSAMERLAARRIFFGTSATLTAQNVDRATGAARMQDLIRRGCRLFYFINYVPVEPGTDDLQLGPDEVRLLECRLGQYRRELPALFIAFPHDEAALGGCLAAGRGFVHVNACGDVQPCPFSPYSDRSLTDQTFEQALGSPLFRAILAGGPFDEADGRCALWARRAWVAELARDRAARGEACGEEKK